MNFLNFHFPREKNGWEGDTKFTNISLIDRSDDTTLDNTNTISYM